jgi:hypothetical protein
MHTKIMMDTNCYDKLYCDPLILKLLIEYLEADRLELYSMPIQQFQIEAISDFNKYAKRKWSLDFIARWTKQIPSLFAFDTKWAGFDQGGLGTPEAYISYYKLDTSRHVDRNMAAIASVLS